MNNYCEYNNLIAFHPGYYIKEMIDDLGITQEEFAKRLDTTPKNISKLVNGEQNLSKEIARKLSNMLGTSVEFWLNLQKNYDLEIIKIEEEKQIDIEKEVLKQIDYNYFVTNFGLPKLTRNITGKVKEIRKFLGISNLNVLKERDLVVNFRSAYDNLADKNIINSNIMLQIAINKAREIESPVYNPKILNMVVEEILTLTTKSPEEFYPLMIERLKEAGVVFIGLPHLKNAGVNGATKKIGNRVLLMLNDRRAYADTFWFSFFHEIGHIVNKDFQIDFNCDVENEIEQKANLYAREKLVPKEAYDNFLLNEEINVESVCRFSEMINRAPGIVVGRLQKDNIIEYNSPLNSLKKKYKFKISNL